MSKIGILGGTFDPIHDGHIALAKAAYEQYNLDKILVMVSKNPPHKKDNLVSDVSHRVNMVKLTIEPYSYMEFSDFELKREGYIYTADTLTLLKEKRPQDEFYFIIGGDSLENLNKWYHPEIVLAKATILASLREGIDDTHYNEIVNTLTNQYKDVGVDVDIRKLVIDAVNISSSNIRENISTNYSVKEYISQPVFDYIIKNDLYNSFTTNNLNYLSEKARKKWFIELRNQIKSKLSNSRYEHTLGVEFTSAALAMRYNENIINARIAGLLHDCAKCIDDDEKLAECIKYDIPVTDIEKRQKYLLHSKLGAYYARHKYNINDKEILDAITYHTTGRPDMTMLEKIVFVADYIEPARAKAKNLNKIRNISFINIDEAIIMILNDTLNYLKDKNEEIDETTRLTYKHYVNQTKKEN